MLRMIKNRFLEYIHIHRRIYYTVSLLLCVGVVCGLVFSALLSDMRQQEIESFVESFCRTSAVDGMNSTQVLGSSFIHNLKIAVILWLCSVSSLFIPVSGFVTLSEGFSIGFTVGSLTRIFGIRGFALSFVSIFPGGVFSVPVIVHLACCSIYYALEKRHRPEISHDRSIMVRFTVTTILCIIILLCASLIDGYISPVFVRSISALF